MIYKATVYLHKTTNMGDFRNWMWKFKVAKHAYQTPIQVHFQYWKLRLKYNNRSMRRSLFLVTLLLRDII